MALGIKSTTVKAEIGDILIADGEVKIYSDSALTKVSATVKDEGKLGVVKKFVPVSGSVKGYIELTYAFGATVYMSDESLYTPQANPDYNYPPVPAPTPVKAPSSGTSVMDVLSTLLKAGLAFLGGKSTSENLDTNGDGTIDEAEKLAQTPVAPDEKTSFQKTIPYILGAVVLGIIGYFVFRVKKPKVSAPTVPATPATNSPAVGLGMPVRQKL